MPSLNTRFFFAVSQQSLRGLPIIPIHTDTAFVLTIEVNSERHRLSLAHDGRTKKEKEEGEAKGFLNALALR